MYIYKPLNCKIQIDQTKLGNGNQVQSETVLFLFTLPQGASYIILKLREAFTMINQHHKPGSSLVNSPRK